MKHPECKNSSNTRHWFAKDTKDYPQQENGTSKRY